MDISSEEEDRPMLITGLNEYDILKEVNNPKSQDSDLTLPLTISVNEIKEVPGAGALYHKYSTANIQQLRMFHLIGYCLEIAGFVIGEIMLRFESEAHSVIPFASSHEFVFIGWAILLFLGGLFIVAMFRLTQYAIEIIADQFSYLYIPVYLLTSCYLSLRNVDNSFTINMVMCCILAFLTAFLFVLYARVKYVDDGRYVIRRTEYLGVHVRVPMLVAWISLELIRKIFACLSFFSNLYESDNQVLLGWSNANWSILFMVLAFALAVILLSTYRDIYFSAVLAYYYAGISYLYAIGGSCPTGYEESNCRRMVMECAISLSGILIFFMCFSLYKHWYRICYWTRKREIN
jgi:hypothetical protein